MDKINGTIYRWKNRVNGKCYIGQTHRRIGERKDEHIRKSKMDQPPTKIARAIKEFGREKFDFKILRRNITNSQLANELEVKEIKNHNSYDDGYNCDKGGMHGFWFGKLWEDREEIKHMYEIQEFSAPKIARIFDVKEGLIYKLLKRLGIQLRTAGDYKRGKPSPKKSPYTRAAERDADEIYRLCFQECKQPSKIAIDYRVGRSVITRILKSRGIDLRGKHPAHLHQVEIVRLYKEEGLDMRQIAKRYNECDPSVISNILKKNGVEIRDGKNPVWKHKKEIVWLYTKILFSTEMIAERYKCSVFLIQSILKSAGVTLRDYAEAQRLYLKRKASNSTAANPTGVPS